MAKIIKIPSAYVIETKVVGVSKLNADGTSRQEIIKQFVTEKDHLQLAAEPDNPFDPDAVKVVITDGKQIGYLSRNTASKVITAIRNGTEIATIVTWVSGDKMVGVGLRLEMESW